jgi:hypothetical protein
LNRKLRAGSRTTSCNAGHDGSASSGSSNSFSIEAENRFSVRDSRYCARPGAPSRGARRARFVRAHLDLARDRAAAYSCLPGVSAASQEPAAGAMISAN